MGTEGPLSRSPAPGAFPQAPVVPGASARPLPRSPHRMVNGRVQRRGLRDINQLYCFLRGHSQVTLAYFVSARDDQPVGVRAVPLLSLERIPRSHRERDRAVIPVAVLRTGLAPQALKVPGPQGSASRCQSCGQETDEWA